MKRSMMKTVFAAVAGFGLLCSTSQLIAEEPAKPEGEAKKQPARQSVIKGTAVTPSQPTPRPADVHANPAPGVVQHTHKHTKQASDIPAPTVQLKEGEIPEIKFDTPTYDFGRVRAGQDIVHDYWFTNTGTGPLEILKIRPSCGCTTAGQHDRIVLPGQSGKIPIKMSVGRASGPSHKTITVNTNCPGAGSTVTLHIQGEVWQPIQATPASASFGRLTTEVADASNMERRLTVVNNTEEKIEIKEIKTSNPAFKADIHELEDGKRFELVVTMVPPLASGPATGNIELITTSLDSPTLQIPVNAYVTADVDVTPNQLTLPALRSGALQRQFFIRNNSATPVTLSDPQSTNEMLAVSVVETQPVGKAFRLTVEIPEDYQVSEDGDQITVLTDNPSVPMLTIPINQAAAPRANVGQQFSAQPAVSTSASAPGTATAEPPKGVPARPADATLTPAASGQPATGSE